jgi:hypothetical protein
MAQIFHPSTNTIAKATIFGALLIVAATAWIAAQIYRSPYVTQQNVAPTQVVPFSHEHHVAGLGIDCRYCHTSVEDSAFAGLPATKVCMSCHSQIWTNAPMLQPVRDSWRTGQPLPWTRVHDLPDYAYFNHGIHIQKGVGCASCHGEIDRMPLTRKSAPLQMEWCLQCHREPHRALRPRDKVFDIAWKWPEGEKQEIEGPKLAEAYHIHAEQLLNCSICHR